MTIISIISLKNNYEALLELKHIMRAHWHLFRLLLKKELLEQHAGQFFSQFWAVFQPLFLILVYTVIFSFIFKIKLETSYSLPLDYTVYILSGLIPWIAFQQSMSKSTVAILSNGSLVKQVVFPIEILPIRSAVSCVVVIVLGCSFVMFYSFVQFQSISTLYLMLPVVCILQIFAMSGVGFLLSTLAVFFRDTKEIVTLFLTVNIFLIPATYLPNMVPRVFRVIVYFNPFSHLVWVYQDILYFGRFEHPVSWLIFIIASLLSLPIGFRVFRKFKMYFGNVL